MTWMHSAELTWEVNSQEAIAKTVMYYLTKKTDETNFI